MTWNLCRRLEVAGSQIDLVFAVSHVENVLFDLMTEIGVFSAHARDLVGQSRSLDQHLLELPILGFDFFDVFQQGEFEFLEFSEELGPPTCFR